jgi:PadR family transcriptional regulator, regulatory protein PadR
MTPDERDVLYGTIGLMVVTTLQALGPLHGYRIARRIEQISRHQLAVNQGTVYPALLKLEQMGWISSKWGESESGRRVNIYTLTRAGRKQLHNEEAQWQRAASIVERFLNITEDAS